jgi:hypothetical protein
LKRATTSILIATALMCAVFVAGADAHTVRYASAVTAKFKKETGKDPASFAGVVTSSVPRCAGARQVNLRMVAADGSSTVVTTAVTDATGAWITPQSGTVAPGSYVAEAAKKVLRKDKKHRHVCAKATSTLVTVK